MIKLIEKIDTEESLLVISATLSLPIDVRVKSRAKVMLDDGREAGFFMQRGSLLRGGDILKSEDGQFVKIVAAPETVSTATTGDALALMKAAYHLGNRHVPLQIEEGYLRYRHDHILDEMLQLMGLVVSVSKEPFEPEAGAYQQTSHQAHQEIGGSLGSSGHSVFHNHNHNHNHDHGHNH
jgi:urease accessory protein